MAEPVTFKYRAFLSYSHADMRWAKWLHAALEGFRIDKDLVGRAAPYGPVPKTLRPIFRDREDFSGGHSLTDATIAALDASAALIVLCSTVSASRSAVNEEVRLFRSRHPDRPVIPVIVEGTWPDNFPLALRWELAADGTITDRAITILGPDLRDSGDGKSLGLAKVVAGITGLGTDEVFRRAERERRRKGRVRNVVVAVLALLAIAATGSAAYAWQQLKTNEAFLTATLKRATEIVNTAVAQAEKYNVPRAATLELLGKAEGLFDDMARLGRPTPELRYQKAWMLIEFARNYDILGDTGKRFARANEAYQLLAGLAAEKPDDQTYQRDLSVAYDEVGDVLVAQGNLPEALKSFRASHDTLDRLAQADPNNAGWQRDLSISQEKVGNVLVAQGNLPEALTSFRASLAIRERLAQADPGNAQWQRDLSISQEKVGDVLVAQGNLPEALTSFRASLAIRERLAQADPGNAQWQRDLSVSNERLGDVYLAQRDLAAALEQYRASLNRMIPIRDADPSNMDLQRFTSVTLTKVGNVLVAQGNLPEALKCFREDLAIAERLAQADPNNAGWQRDVAVSHGKLATIYFRQSETIEALVELRAGRAIMAALVERAPSSAQWKNDLTWFEMQIAALDGQARDAAGK